MQIQILIVADINDSEKEKMNDELTECIFAGCIGGCGSSLLMTGIKGQIRVSTDLMEKFPPMLNHVLKAVETDQSNAMLL
jgi:hypothetical protein